jgi:Sulfatase
VCLAVAFALACGCAGGDEERRSDVATSRPPVVVVILDELPTDDLLGPDGRIDAERFPNFAELASISTWFPNAYTVYDSTFKAVPDILDAQLPERGTAPDVRSHQPSVFHLMNRLGYEIHKVESATAVCPPRICVGARARRPGVLDRLKGGGRPARLHKWIGQIRPRARPAFYLHHALLPHEPWIYLPSGRPNRPYGEDPIEGINSKASFGDARLSEHNHMRHLLQVGYTDLELGRLLDRLRRTGLLRRAALAVVADHGYAFDIGVQSRRLVSEATIDEVGPVPFFLKAPGQMQGEVDESLVRNIDLVPSIAEQLGTRLWWRHDGRSVEAPETRARDEMAIRTRDLRQVIRIGRDELEARRRANRRRWARLFGTGAQSRLLFGDPWASVYRIGPHRTLLDRRVAALDARPRAEAATGNGVRAVIANAALLRNVSGRAAIVPTRITGRLEGRSREGLRPLAVAVNGRIRAVGRSFRLGRRRATYFSFVIPESALRPGRNRAEVFEVDDGGRTLISLGRVS